MEELRAPRIAARLDRHLKAGDKVLAFGCGSQIVAEQVQKRSKVEIVGLDALEFSKRALPMVLYDGLRAPLLTTPVLNTRQILFILTPQP